MRIRFITYGLTRAVHLEVVTDLNVETFVQTFHKLVFHKSLLQMMHSDKPSTCASVAKELDQLLTSPLTPSHCCMADKLQFYLIELLRKMK